MTESNRIEFKRQLTKELDIEREVIAFLNYREGGSIYIGIDDEGKTVGVKDIDADMLKIKDRIRMGISPSPMGLFDVQTERIDGVQVIKITVASGTEKPYYKPQYGMSPRGCFIHFSENFIRLVLPIAKQKQINDTNNDTTDDTIKLTYRQQIIVSLIKENDTIKIAQMIPLLKVSQITIKRDLAYLQNVGIIRRVGNKVSGHWEIIKQN